MGSNTPVDKAIEIRLKLAIVVPSLESGGGVPAAAEFIKDVALRSGRFDVKLISLCMSSREDTSVELRRPASWFRGVRTRTGVWQGLPFTHVGAYMGELEFQRNRPRPALVKLLEQCDLIQVVCGSPAWANTVIGLGTPVALQVATLIEVERKAKLISSKGPLGWWHKGMTQIISRMDDRALRRVDAVQVENPWMLDYVREINKGRDVDIRYAPPGINAAIFQPRKGRDLESGIYILCVGRLDDSRKNVSLLLEAFASLPAIAGEGVQLKLAGLSGPEPEFWQRTSALGVADRVSYIQKPKENELVELYQNANMFVSSSDEEGLGIVVLEAMACGLPVICTRSGGPDGIIDDGKDGYLVPLNDADAMATRMAELISNPSLNRSMGEMARKKIEERYEEHIAGEVFLEIWKNLLERNNSKQGLHSR